MDFINITYMNLENQIKDYMKNGGNLELIIRNIRKASLDGEIASYEEIHLMDLLELEMEEDIDDHYVQQFSKDTGGLPIILEEEEKHDMSYLDDFNDYSEKEEGFLGFLNKKDEE